MRVVVLALLLVPSMAVAQTVTCPTVVDLQTGKFSSSSKNYKCYSSAAAAKKAGFVKAPAPSARHEWSGVGNYTTEIFSLKKGSKVSHSCSSGGYFGVKIRKASDGSLLDLPVNNIAPSSGDTRTYDSGAVYVEISTTSQCSWSVSVG